MNPRRIAQSLVAALLAVGVFAGAAAPADAAILKSGTVSSHDTGWG